VPGFLRAGVEAGFFAAPEGVDVVKVADGGQHDVDDEVACVNERPFAAVAFGAEDFEAGFFEADGDVVGEGFDLAGAVAAVIAAVSVSAALVSVSRRVSVSRVSVSSAAASKRFSGL